MLFCRDMDEDEEEETSHWLLVNAPAAAAEDEDAATGNDIFEDVDPGDPATECELFGL